MPSPRVPSERVIANRKARVVLSRSVLNAVNLGMADGLMEIGERIIADARDRAPRDPEAARKRGVPMMADTGHAAVFLSGKLVAGDTGKTASQNKPRGVRTPKDQAVLAVWFSSPISHFAERGTIKQVAHPFLLPAFNAQIEGAKITVPSGMRARAQASR